MTRIRFKSNPELTGTLVRELPDGEIRYRDEDGQEWDTQRARVEFEEDEEAQEDEDAPRPLELQLLDMLDHLRDGLNLQMEATMNGIRRVMKQREQHK